MRINISLFKKQVETVDLRPPPKNAKPLNKRPPILREKTLKRIYEIMRRERASSQT
jgi:hypothetical protein